MRKQRIKITLTNKTYKEIDMSDFSIIPDDMFSGRKDIYTIELPEGVYIIRRNAFEGCISMKKVVLPDTVKLIDEEAFCDCYNLSEINLPAMAKVHETAFKHCHKLKKIS
jgi:hypothetical protein